jgi:hypothetical protein
MAEQLSSFSSGRRAGFYPQFGNRERNPQFNSGFAFAAFFAELSPVFTAIAVTSTLCLDAFLAANAP